MIKPPETVLDAVRRRDWASIRTQLEDLAATGDAGAEVLALLASARAASGDAELAHGAADQALIKEPANLRAALVKADLLWAQGDRREANFFYRAVVQNTAAATSLAPDLVEGVARAREIRDFVSSDIFARIREELEREGYSEARSSSRFTLALDLATGRKQPYFQQPRAFYFPELPNTQFYPRAQFPWLDRVEAATEAMTAELEAVLGEDEAFAPYIQSVANMPVRADYPLVDSMAWSACFLSKDGVQTPNAARCPQTMAALAEAPLCRIKARSPQIMFSQLQAGAHIEAHTGYLNTRLVCHVPLVTPPDCHFRVGNEVRSWRRGEAWVFDDSIEHEAINRSDRTRVVLIFDIWRPELTEEERHLVTTLLETMDAYSPKVTKWD
ncbi:MAG TPA: aspartyl/asparaginyl beta-hydroxylase domain-containing protein [Brevundimonas sp.]|nr:aspartyl/asparaginyl beta-hydroxylase domain-containing protein [Brevundimonas sp.]